MWRVQLQELIAKARQVMSFTKVYHRYKLALTLPELYCMYSSSFAERDLTP
jgi:hypothetical protein